MDTIYKRKWNKHISVVPTGRGEKGPETYRAEFIKGGEF
jgi:hypothetical protein